MDVCAAQWLAQMLASLRASVNEQCTWQVIGEDASPGIKRGGYINLVRRTVRCLCAGEDIPESLEINVAAMDIGASVLLGQLPLPEGVVHAVREESHLAQPLCKIGGRARRTD